MITFVIRIMMMLLLAYPVWVTAQEKSVKSSETLAPVTPPEKANSKGDSKQESQTSELIIVGKGNGTKGENFRLTMGDGLTIKTTGTYTDNIRTELAKADGSRALALYLDGVRMANLTASPLEIKSKNELHLSFYLSRNSHDDENRKAWDIFLAKQNEYLMKPAVALAVGNNIPWAVQSTFPVEFYIAQNATIGITFFVGLVIFLVAFYLLVENPAALRDSKAGFYSLGKSQMAFWGLLVILAFASVWLVTGTMERIPQQVLILLGISGATGLGAIVIGENKKASKESENQISITKLQEELQKLEKEELTAPAAFTQASKDRLASIKVEIAALSKQTPSVEPPRFWKDICDDGNGLSFHRLQVVIWTVVLGVVFLWSVAQVISMPEFPETLLVLMGISNGTYLGFKFPEKQ
jgi:hypothetical protein